MSAILTSPTLHAPMVDARCIHTRCSHRNDDAYRLVGKCLNCQSDPVVGMFSFGHEASSGALGPACPRCGCREIRWRGMEDDEARVAEATDD